MSPVQGARQGRHVDRHSRSTPCAGRRPERRARRVAFAYQHLAELRKPPSWPWMARGIRNWRGMCSASIFATKRSGSNATPMSQAHIGAVIAASPSQGRDRNGNLIEGKAEEAKRLQKELHTIASRLPGPVLWVGAKRVVGERGRDVGALSLPDDFDDRAHYGKLRGLNEWEHCTSVLAIGRESVSVATLEGIARAFLTRDPKPLIPLLGHDPEDGDAAPKYGWCKVTRMRRMRDGSLSPVEVEVHPDPRVQMVFEQMRESELIEGIDRVQPIFNRRWIALLNNLCLDVTYDRVLTHREMVAGGSRMEIAYQATGILPMGARDLHALSAKFGLGLFQTEDAAKRALKVGRSSNKRTLYLEFRPSFLSPQKPTRQPKLGACRSPMPS